MNLPVRPCPLRSHCGLIFEVQGGGVETEDFKTQDAREEEEGRSVGGGGADCGGGDSECAARALGKTPWGGTILLWCMRKDRHWEGALLFSMSPLSPDDRNVVTPYWIRRLSGMEGN